MRLNHPEDVCTCGDYRWQHVDGTGACTFNETEGGSGHLGAPDCTLFVPSLRASDTVEFADTE